MIEEKTLKEKIIGIIHEKVRAVPATSNLEHRSVVAAAEKIEEAVKGEEEA